MEPIASSTGRASICLSIGFASKGLNVSSLAGLRAGGDVACPEAGELVGFLRVDRPLRNLLKDSRNDFLKDLRREIGVSP